MKAVMAKITGQAEGKVVSEIVRQKLSKLAN
jgi:Glu-tRNA(Gln) amidotransferase subunit E-like FAD-binding protein